MLRLKELTLARFRSFKEPSTLKLPDRGLTMVRGNGSGTGKSSLFLAIADAVDACPVPATQLQNWDTEEPRNVNVTFAVDGGSTFSVKRGSSLSLTVDGKDVKGVAVRLWERVAELMGLRRLEWIVPLTYRPQKCRSFFLTLSDADKKEFLSGVLGLDHLEEELAKSDEAAGALGKKLQAAEKRCTEAETGFRLAEERAAGLQPIACLSIEEELELRTTELGVFQAEEHRLLKQMPPESPLTPEEIEIINSAPPAQPMIAEFEKRLRDVDQRMAVRMAAWTQATKEHQAAVRQNSQLQADRLQKGMLLERYKGRRAQLDRDVGAANLHGECPTCKQAWTKADEHFAKLEVELAQIVSQIQELEAWLDDPEHFIRMNSDPPAPPDQTEDLALKAELRKRLDRQHQARVQWASTNTSKIMAVYTAQNSRTAVARAGHQEELEKVRKLIGDRRVTVENIKGQLRAAKDVNARAAEAADVLGAAKFQLHGAQTAYAEVQAALNLELDFQALVGAKGFLGSIFDEILAEISAKTNELLAKLPNVNEVTMALTSSKTAATTKKQTRAITPSFRKRGHVTEKNWDLVFSGGQVTAIELAIDLAVAQVVGQRTGVTPGWLILDEPFVGLPAAEVEQVLEVLQVLAQDRLVLVIDHLPDAQQWFPHFIDIRMENGETKIVDNAG